MIKNPSAGERRNPATDLPETPAAARHPAAPRFDPVVPHSGYHWWYVDGISDDGNNGVVVIAFIGSVFSPYYFRARSRAPADPLDYCAINVGLYRKSGKLWAMTERGRHAVEQGIDWFSVGRSSLRWESDHLAINIDERSVPFGQRLTGTIHVRPAFLNDEQFDLDPGGRHSWRPIAPVGRIDVRMAKPALRWQGDAYLDMNRGARALEKDFAGWNWSRHGNQQGAEITYAANLLDGSERSLALRFDKEGHLERIPVPKEVTLPTTGWRVARRTRASQLPSVRRTLEDTPFYARSILEQASESGSPKLIMHESLSLDRFKSAWVRTLLPFRMPRLAGKPKDQA